MVVLKGQVEPVQDPVEHREGTLLLTEEPVAAVDSLIPQPSKVEPVFKG